MVRRADYIPPLLRKRMVEKEIPDIQTLAQKMSKYQELHKSRLADYIRGEHGIPLARALHLLDALEFKASESTEALKLLRELDDQIKQNE